MPKISVETLTVVVLAIEIVYRAVVAIINVFRMLFDPSYRDDALEGEYA